VFGKKIRHSISPTKFMPDLSAKICQTLFSVRPICVPKKASNPKRKKKLQGNVKEIDTFWINVIIKSFFY